MDSVTPLTPEERERLRALAEKATPGPWEAQGDGRIVRPGYTRKGDGTPKRRTNRDRAIVSIEPNGACSDPECCDQGSHLQVLPNNAAFIAAFNPETAKALLDRLAQVEALEQAQRPTCATCKWWKLDDMSPSGRGFCHNPRVDCVSKPPASFSCSFHQSAPPTPEATR